MGVSDVLSHPVNFIPAACKFVVCRARCGFSLCTELIRCEVASEWFKTCCHNHNISDGRKIYQMLFKTCCRTLHSSRKWLKLKTLEFKYERIYGTGCIIITTNIL